MAFPLISSAYRQAVRLHSGVPYALSRSGRALPPWHFFFEITRRCNLRCQMCQYIEFLNNVPAKQQRDGELSTQEWLDAIDQTGPLSLITFTGGEVWLRKDFGEILAHASSKRRVHFISNAVLIDEARAEACIELAPRILGGRGLNFVGISIDGTEAIHDRVRAQDGAFGKSLAGLDALVAEKRRTGKSAPGIHINTVLLNENLDVLPELPALVKEHGADVLNLLTEMRAQDNQDLGHVDPGTFGSADVRIPRIDPDRLRESLRETLRRAEGVGLEVRTPRMPFETIVEHYDGGYDLQHMACPSIWTNLYVGAKGGVYPCFIQKVGNIRETPLRELWNGPELRAFRRRRRQGAFEVCRGCCEAEYCRRSLPEPLAPDEPRSNSSATGGSVTMATRSQAE